MNSNPIRLCSYKKDIGTRTHTEERPHEDTGKRWPSMRQGDELQKKATLLTP
jgi:hypothetical protein